MRLSRSIVEALPEPANDYRWRVIMPGAPVPGTRDLGSTLMDSIASSLTGIADSALSSAINNVSTRALNSVSNSIGGLAGSAVNSLTGTAGQLASQLGVGTLNSLLGIAGGSGVFVERIGINFAKIPSKGRFTGGSFDYYPDNSNIDGFPITFYEDEFFTVTRYLYQWSSAVCSSDGNVIYGLPAVYKRSLICGLFNRISDLNPVLSLRYTKIWPTDRESWSLNYNDEGRLTVTANFSVDNPPEIV